MTYEEELSMLRDLWTLSYKFQKQLELYLKIVGGVLDQAEGVSDESDVQGPQNCD
jgi:hypothetical protein